MCMCLYWVGVIVSIRMIDPNLESMKKLIIISDILNDVLIGCVHSVIIRDCQGVCTECNYMCNINTILKKNYLY